MENSQAGPAVSGVVVSLTQVRPLAVAAYLAGFKGQSRVHTESDLRGYLNWCEARGFDPLAVSRPHIELYLRWLQEVRQHRPFDRFTPDVRGRRLLPHLRHRLGARALTGRITHARLTHLQFEALLSAARHSTNPCDFALVTMLGLLGLRIFEATGSNIEDLGEEHDHRVLRVRGKGDKVALVPLAPAVGRAMERAIEDRTTARSCSPAEAPAGTGTAPPDGCCGWPRQPG